MSSMLVLAFDFIDKFEMCVWLVVNLHYDRMARSAHVCTCVDDSKGSCVVVIDSQSKIHVGKSSPVYRAGSVLCLGFGLSALRMMNKQYGQVEPSLVELPLEFSQSVNECTDMCLMYVRKC